MRLRRPLERKKVEGCARAAMRSNEVDDIGGDGVVRLFRGFERALGEIE